MWREGTPGQRAELAARMDSALRDSGFLLIEGHGIDAELRARIRASARDFFHLPETAKARYATPVGGRGWIPQGGEANAFYGEQADPGRADMKESITIGRNIRTGDEEKDNEWFRANVWPGECPGLEAPYEEFTAQARNLYYDLLRLSALGLGLDDVDWFADRAQRGPHTFSINRYPPLTLTGKAKDGQYFTPVVAGEWLLERADAATVK
ncbi:MAG: 2-oxoglutarate and iron-dependent oxygenase domain-containing protein [Trebonia sp.]